MFQGRHRLPNDFSLCAALGRQRQPPPAPVVVTVPVGFYDCYFDYANADPSVCVDIYEVLAEPCLASCTTTGYIEHDHDQICQTLAIAELT